jgi:hypothetical protein
MLAAEGLEGLLDGGVDYRHTIVTTPNQCPIPPPDDRVTVYPATLQYGPPSERNPRHRTIPARTEERLFRDAVDAWLDRGGWAAGRDGAVSLEVRFLDDAGKRRIINRWRHELVIVRGWSADLVASQFGPGPHGEQRFYFWTTDEGRALPMPEPPVRPGWKRRRQEFGPGRLLASEAEARTATKAARKLDVSPLLVAETAIRLWRRSLNEERDRIVAERAVAGDDPDRLRALRGWVTRQLVDQIADEIDRELESREVDGPGDDRSAADDG